MVPATETTHDTTSKAIAAVFRGDAAHRGRTITRFHHLWHLTKRTETKMMYLFRSATETTHDTTSMAITAVCRGDAAHRGRAITRFHHLWNLTKGTETKTMYLLCHFLIFDFENFKSHTSEN